MDPEEDVAVILSRARSLAIEAAGWPELAALFGEVLPQPLSPHVILPLAAARAVGAQQGIEPLLAAWALICAAVRILDDCADQDNPGALHLRLGIGRALNLGTALLTSSTALLGKLQPASTRDAILADFLEISARVWAGQERDLRNDIRSLEAYLRLAEDKTAFAFGFAMAAGARLLGERPEWVLACRQCGYHVGMMLQLLDDLEALWFPDGPSDLALGKWTFPILLGLKRPGGAALRALLDAEPLSEEAIRAALDEMEMRPYLVWAALEERDRALAALGACPADEGRALLGAYLDLTLDGVARLLP